MTREQKIDALAEAFNIEDIGWANEKELAQDSFKAGLLAGIRLRDEELLAMELNSIELMEAADKTFETLPNFESKHFIEQTPQTLWSRGFCVGARWQHEQFMKAIKGE